MLFVCVIFIILYHVFFQEHYCTLQFCLNFVLNLCGWCKAIHVTYYIILLKSPKKNTYQHLEQMEKLVQLKIKFEQKNFQT